MAVESIANGNWSSDAATCWDSGSRPGDSDDVIIKNGHNITITQAERANSFKIEAGGTLTVSSGSNQAITVDNEGNGSGGTTNGYAVDIDGAIVNAAAGKFDLVIETPAETALDLSPSSGNVNNLTINHASCDAGVDSSCTLTGNIEVTAGILELTNYSVSAVLVHGNGEVQIGGSATYTTTNDWRPDNTKLISDGATVNIGDQMGGAWNCNSKQVAINCKRFHSTISMTNGTSLISDNSAEDVIVTATAAESNASVYGPLQGRINLITNSSGSKDFELKEDLTVNGRIVVSGSGEFRTYTSSNTFDLLVDGATFHSSNGGSAYSCLDVTGSAKFLSGSSSVILDAALGSNLCDIGEFNGTDGQNVTGWTPYGNNTVVYDSNSAKITYVDNATGAFFMLNSTALSDSGLTVGKVYKATFDAKINTGSVNLKWTTQSSSLPFGANSETHAYLLGATTRNETLSNTSYEKRVAYFVAGLETSIYLYVSNMSSGEVVHIDNMTVEEVMANGSTGSAGHKQSYGLDITSTSTACNLGTGFYYSCGTRWAGQNHTKTSGRFCAGSGDSTEYFSGGGNSLSLGTTDIIFLTNVGATSSIGWNISTTTWDCRGFYFYASSASHFHAYWSHGSGNTPTVNSPSSSTATKIHTYDCDMYILKGKFRTQYPAADKFSVGIVCTGDVRIFNGGELETHQDAYTSGTSCDHSFGSLTVDSGGTYKATSKTTTITNKNSSNYMFDNNGTFTHNNGTVHWKADTSSGTWYAMDGASSATETEFYNISTERVRASGTEQYRFWVGGSGRHLTVLNNIDIGANTSIFSSNGSGNFKLLGNCYIRGTTGGLNLDNVTTVNMGTVSIESGGTLEFADGNSINVEGIRNMGGTVTAT